MTAGIIIDTETELDAIRNVAIKCNSIVRLSQFPCEDDLAIDAAGHVVAFSSIELHAHGQKIGSNRLNAPRLSGTATRSRAFTR